MECLFCMLGTATNSFNKLFLDTSAIVINPILQMRNLTCSELKVFPKSHS